MVDIFKHIAEQKIKKAVENGELEDLQGKGKPLKFKDSNVPEEYRLGYKILKNSGYLPEELEIEKEIEKYKCMVEKTKDVDEKRKLLKKITYMNMQKNLMKEKRLKKK